MGKAAIYNPYLDTLTFAKVLAEIGYDVDIEWKDISIKEKLSKRFGIKLPVNIEIVNSVNRGENYDICFWVSDGSIPTLRARKNYLHFQVPFHDVNGSSLLNKMKLFRINKVICNSNFTKKIVDNEYCFESVVLYPPVDVISFKQMRKVNQICYVARFSNLTQNKGHAVLIEQFKKLVKFKKFNDWSLVLAGGIEVGSDEYLKKLKKISKGSNIKFIESPTFSEVKNIFGHSKIFWSGSGYEIDEQKNPEMTEHFGLTLVESMSAGCVPIAYSAGGHKEIIEDGINGYLWTRKNDLVSLTDKIINTPRLSTNLSKKAVETSKRFGYEEFKKAVLQIIK